MRNERTESIRKEIIRHLEEEPLTVREISQTVGIMEKDVYHHLPFIEKSIKQQKKRLDIDPYHCLSCGFRFNKRKTFKKPGKCST